VTGANDAMSRLYGRSRRSTATSPDEDGSFDWAESDDQVHAFVNDLKTGEPRSPSQIVSTSPDSP
jgi:hypothetical protein